MLKERDGRYYLVIQDAKIMFRNFEGREKTNNRAGDRNFCVRIDDPEEAQKLAADGWNIKTLSPRDGVDDDEVHFLQVKLNYGRGRPPKIEVLRLLSILITGRSMVRRVLRRILIHLRLRLSTMVSSLMTILRTTCRLMYN